jgi:hypothetical protein
MPSREVDAMKRVVSIHEYQLRPDTSPESFEKAIVDARGRGIIRLPGLVDSYFLRRIRGSGGAPHASIWIYESKQAWEKLWGEVGRPLGQSDYPANWRVWEDQVLAKFLDRDPDRIVFSAYEEF